MCVLYWGPTNIRHNRTKFCCPGWCAAFVYYWIKILRERKFCVGIKMVFYVTEVHKMQMFGKILRKIFRLKRSSSGRVLYNKELSDFYSSLNTYLWDNETREATTTTRWGDKARLYKRTVRAISLGKVRSIISKHNIQIDLSLWRSIRIVLHGWCSY
jgi:hypothetical protein